MQVQDIMTKNPACCVASASLQEVAQKMAECDCGEIPVVDAQKRPIGVVTDRDICIRAVAQGRDTVQTKADEIMSTPVYTVKPEDDLDECLRQMEAHNIRRVPVVDDKGMCCGIVAQADIATRASPDAAADVVRDISRAGSAPH
jgi:CBS domain-containing protein